MPTTITQPNGVVINCYVTGDEYYSWLNDVNNFTIVENQITGYYCYAILQNDELIPSQYIVGNINPIDVGLLPNINISQEKMMEFYHSDYGPGLGIEPNLLKSNQVINNIVVYITFSDESDFNVNQSSITDIFMNTNPQISSLNNFYEECSYGKLSINSTFYPTNNGTLILAYHDVHPKNYYNVNSVSNPIGFNPNRTASRLETRLFREVLLVHNALEFVKSQIPSTIDIDTDNDGFVDNVTFVVKGGATNSGSILWPHHSIFQEVSLYPELNPLFDDYINSKQKGDYILVSLETLNTLGNTVLYHEFAHTLGAPDLYCKFNNPITNFIGGWDLMSNPSFNGIHMNAYIKYEYFNWIDEIPEITSSGTYTINSLLNSENNCYKIKIKNSFEYILIENRYKSGVYESGLPNSGLLFYIINEYEKGNGNYGALQYSTGSSYYNLEAYLYRLNGTPYNNGLINSANFSSEVGRTVFSNYSNPYCFTFFNSSVPYEVGLGNVFIKNIGSIGNTMTFDVRFCDGDIITYINTNELPNLVNASDKIITNSNVKILQDRIVTFEAANEIILNSGFQVDQGGLFEMSVNGCGLK